jgi:pyridoxamine 5'-phosphate oxidase
MVHDGDASTRKPKMTDARVEDLAAIEAAVWRELGRAVGDTEHGWRICVLATTDGKHADARCVVLREFDASSRTLLIFTDARSPKAAQIEAHPHGTLVLWSEPLGWQLRLRVTLSLETAGLAVSSRWARLKMTPAAHDYLSPLPPGSPAPPPGSKTAACPARDSRDFFAVLSAEIHAIDWLELHALGHRRAVFDARGRRWVTP